MRRFAAKWSERVGKLRGRTHWLALAWLLLALSGFAVYANRSYPIADWAALSWARAWLAALGFIGASLAVGLRVLATLRVYGPRDGERIAIATAVGVLTFALGIFVGGFLHLLGWPFFLLWPAALLALGFRSLVRQARRFARMRAKFGSRLWSPQTPAQGLAALGLVLGALILYAQIVTPGNISFDARWYHLTIADHYASAGAIRAYPEGWYIGAYPHLASWLYTWAFLAPGGLAQHLCLAAHLEFVLLLATLGAISALANRLISGGRARFAGAALFVFPAIFSYDSNLNGGADHVLAFWAAPLGLVLLRYLSSTDLRHALVLGLVLGGAVLTKLQAVYFVVPVALVLGAQFLLRRRFKPLLLAAGTTLAVSSPFWLKNWIAYGDPLYPNLFRWFHDHPLYPGATAVFDRGYWFAASSGPRSFSGKVLGTARVLWEFSFAPLGWGRGPEPGIVIGSLFTLLLPLLAWARPFKRVLIIAVCAHIALAIWFLTYPYDRYLQDFMPWLAACTAAALVAAWQMRWFAIRATVALLVLLQVLWGGDTYLLRANQMLAQLPLRAMDSLGQHKKLERQAYGGEELVAIGAQLPKGSKIVGHDFYQSVGAGVPAVWDQPLWAGRIEYLQLDTPEVVFHTWREVGATHILWPYAKEARAADDLARDAVFARASVAFSEAPFTVAGFRVAKLVDRPGSALARQPTQIAWLGCGDRTLGIYTPAGLAAGHVVEHLSQRSLRSDPRAVLANANAVWIKDGCADANGVASALEADFVQVMRSGNLGVWVRRSGPVTP